MRKVCSYFLHTKKGEHGITRVNMLMYLGGLEELIQNLRQGWVRMNSKFDVLQDTDGYVQIQAFIIMQTAQKLHN